MPDGGNLENLLIEEDLAPRDDVFLKLTTRNPPVVPLAVDGMTVSLFGASLVMLVSWNLPVNATIAFAVTLVLGLIGTSAYSIHRNRIIQLRQEWSEEQDALRGSAA